MRIIATAVIALFVMGIVTFGTAGDIRAQDPKSVDLVVRVAALEAALKDRTNEVLDLAKQLKTQDERLKAIEAWLKKLPLVVTRLESGVASSDAQGFTKAGVNFEARETLLNALRSFGSGLRENLPAPAPTSNSK